MADANGDIQYGYPGNPGFMQDSPFVPEPNWGMPQDPMMQVPADFPFQDPFGFPGFPGMPPIASAPGMLGPEMLPPGLQAGPMQGAQQPGSIGAPASGLPITQPMQPQQMTPQPLQPQPQLQQPRQEQPSLQMRPISSLPPNDASQLPSRMDASNPAVGMELRGTPAPGYDATTLPLVQAKFDPKVGRMRNPEVEEKGKRSGLIIAIIVLSAISLALAAALLYVLDPFGVFGRSEVDPPSEVQVENAFDSAYIPPPDLLPYKYIDDAGLELVSMSDYAAGEVNYDTTNNASEPYSQCSALATYRNESVTVEQSLSLRMVFDRAAKSWSHNSAVSLSLNVIPIAPPDVEAIIADFDSIATAYSASLGAMYDDAAVEADPESKLTANGGILTLLADKTATDGAQLKCALKCVVGWSNESGWVVKVDSADGDLPPDLLQAVGDNDADAITPIATTTETVTDTVDDQAPPAEGEGGEGGQEGEGAADGSVAGDGSSQVQYRLTCPNGAKVKVPGTIEMDGGRTLLKTFGLMEVLIGDQAYQVDYFEIIGGQGFEPGQGVDVCGTIGTAGTLPKAPLTIRIG